MNTEPDAREILVALDALVRRLDTLTTDQFAHGGDRAEREAARLLVAKKTLADKEKELNLALDRAKQQYGSDDIQFDDDAAVSEVDAGYWVSAWVFVPGWMMRG